MANTKKPKPKTKKSEDNTVPKVRKVKVSNYRSFRLSKKIVHPAPKLPSAFSLFRASIRHLLDHKKLFFGIVIIYLLLTIMLVKGLGLTNDVAALKDALGEIFTGGSGKIISSAAIFSILVGSTGGASSDVAGVYQSMLLIVISLAIIWALRQTYAKKQIGVREAFYKGLYPLVPFLLVLLVVGLQMLPLLIGSSLYSAVNTNELAVNFGEKFVWGTLFAALALLSFYMTASSLFALYIVTLPDVRPFQALRSAKGLVRYRRWMVMRKILFLPVFLIVIGALIVMPLIIFVTPLAEWVFFALTMLSLAIIHSYMYNLYRSLL